jgi:endonuclease/exonuclease/phosphatase family metal-dependent hydrolase
VSAIRAATWNVRGIRAGVDAVAALIREQEVEVLLVQESGPRRRLRSLGATLGMEVAADPFAFPRRRAKDAVLVRPPRRIRSHRQIRFRGASLLYPRGALIARLDDLTVMSVHLGLNGAERRDHVAQLLAVLRDEPGPILLGGDLNANPWDPAVAGIADAYPDVWAAVGVGDGPTMPAADPKARIDFLFAGPAVQPLRVRTVPTTASDHLMVVADLEITRSR